MFYSWFDIQFFLHLLSQPHLYEKNSLQQRHVFQSCNLMTWLIFILGAIFAGFVQGLTGFAFALIAMSFWVWILPPQIAAPLVGLRFSL